MINVCQSDVGRRVVFIECRRNIIELKRGNIQKLFKGWVWIKLDGDDHSTAFKYDSSELFWDKRNDKERINESALLLDLILEK